MREQNGWALAESIRSTLNQSVLRESGTQSVPIHVNVYRPLGVWNAPAPAPR